MKNSKFQIPDPGLKKGFTLIETIIYTLIVSFVISSFLFIIANTLASADRADRNLRLIDERQFMIQKIDWALQSVLAVNSPAAGGSGATLSVDKIGFLSNPVVVDLAAGKLRIKQGSGAAVPITISEITVSNPVFTYTVSGSEHRIRFTATLTNSATTTSVDYTKIIR